MTHPLFSDALFKDFDKLFVGFDEHFGRLAKLHTELTKNIPNYPPVNIRKVGDSRYTIEMAVAGFGQHDLDIELADNKLVVRGNLQSTEDDQAGNFLFQGIAKRAFTRAFVLNEKVEVQNAQLANGMLRIMLERLAPEAPKSKKVPVTTN